MMRILKKFTVAVFIFSAVFNVLAGPRVLRIENAGAKIIPLYLRPFFVLSIHLPHAEHIKSIHCGDSAAWDISTQQLPYPQLFIKPISRDSNTNLIVTTDRTSYYFHLQVVGSPTVGSNQVYSVILMDPRASKSSTKKDVKVKKLRHRYFFNLGYYYCGDWQLRPQWAFDDGQFTYFRFVAGQALPAIYRYDISRHASSLTNFRVVHHDLMLPERSFVWLLRRGKHEGYVYRRSVRGLHCR